jgi:hypothetical protein
MVAGTRRELGRSPAMPLLILILLIILIAQFGFWDTLQAVLGAVAMIVLFWALVIAVVIALFGYIYRRLR